MIIKPRDNNATDGEYWQHACIYIFICTHHPLYMQPPTARVTRVWLWLPATPAQKTKRCSLASSALLCFACLLSRAGVSAGHSQHLPPTIQHPSCPRAEHPPTSPSPSPCPPPINPPSLHPSAIAASLRQYQRLCVPSPCIPNPSQITPAAPRGGAASVTTAHPPSCCCPPPSISRRSRSPQGALTTA